MHKCEFCNACFQARPQVKHPRACQNCQKKRQQENETSIENYLAHLSEFYSKDESAQFNKFVHESYSAINRFFRFCISEKKVTYNPCDKIKVSHTQKRIHICTPDQIKKLQAYIKSPNANSEYAILLALVLFYGLTTDDLKCAQIAEPFTSTQLKIVLRRRPRSHWKKYYHRAQTMICSNQPSWFLRSQLNFLKSWRIHYAQVKSTYPRFSFILPRHNGYNRPLASDTIRGRMKEATTAATGINIPIRVLRHTCGHLHTKYRDASALSTLGWSPEFAYHLVQVFF
jgi:integrase